MATRTALQLITDAWHRCGLIAEDESLNANQTSRSLSVLNDMMNGLEAGGIQYQHTDLALGDTVNVPDFLLRSVTWLFVKEIADEYGKGLSDSQRQEVEDARSNLEAAYYRVPQAQTDEGIRNRRTFFGTVTTTTPL